MFLLVTAVSGKIYHSQRIVHFITQELFAIRQIKPVWLAQWARKPAESIGEAHAPMLNMHTRFISSQNTLFLPQAVAISPTHRVIHRSTNPERSVAN